MTKLWNSANIPASRVVFRHDATERAISSAASFAKRRALVHYVRSVIGQSRDPDRGVHAVLYPMAGVDASLFGLFPRARYFIALDEHPFFPFARARALTIETCTHIIKDYHLVSEVNSAQRERRIYNGEVVLSALATYFPNFRLHNLFLFSTQARDDFRRVHGVVAFDQGPQQPRQYYLHLNVRLEVDEPVEYRGDWWHNVVDQLSPSAVMVKAAMHTFDTEPVCSLWPDIVGWLRRSRGLLVEGAANGWGEFSRRVRWGGATTIAAESEHRFGYAKSFQVTLF